MNIDNNLRQMHSYLMNEKFPYHSVSVIHRYQDLQYHVMFTEDVKHMITEKVKSYLKAFKFNYSVV